MAKKIYKNPVEQMKAEMAAGTYFDPFDKLPNKDTKLEEYDAAIDMWLNGLDEGLLEGVEPSNFGQGFIDDAENSYYDAPIGYKPPVEHHDYIRNKVNELINNKYTWLKPWNDPNSSR